MIESPVRLGVPLEAIETPRVRVEPRGLVAHVATCLSRVDIRAWDALVPRDEPQLRCDFLRAVENAAMMQGAVYLSVRRESDAHYSDEEAIVGVAVVYQTDIDLLTLASPRLTSLASKIRKGPLQRFGFVGALSCGPVINNCRSNLFVSPHADPVLARRVVAALLQEIEGLKGNALRVLFEFTDEAAALYGPAMLQNGYVRGASLPGTKLEARWADFDAYLAAMRKFYRRAVNADLKAGRDLIISVETDFAHLAEEACALYENVMARAEVVMERLTPAFFRELGSLEQTRLVTMREAETNRLVGIELLIVGDNTLQDLYTGLDYELNDKHHLYFNLVYPGIRLACAHGLDISMGQTSYGFKSRLGVTSYPLHLFVKHRNPLVQALLRVGNKLLFPVVEAPSHRVFHCDE